MKVLRQYPCLSLNTLGLRVDANFFVRVASIEELPGIRKFIRDRQVRYLILGGGSNVLFTGDYDGLILKVELRGIDEVVNYGPHVLIRVSAGEDWDGFVDHCVKRGWGGLENLSMIPGSVGAAPVQNIGAYGVEMKDCLECLEAYDMDQNRMITFSARECRFGYRDSIFKSTYGQRMLICSVTFRLRKEPMINISYGTIRQELERMQVKEPGIADVRKAVCTIRSSRLPDPLLLGNAGSFFKNPEVEEGVYNSLKSRFPAITAYPTERGTFKLAAGWLIEHCGWRGKRLGRAGVFDKQALVLVNYGGASASELLELAEKIKNDVKERFGVYLETEVNII
ncbi:MAG: UDP-N-acetylmuramate dehydrogenase [Bacteroidales bacterium]|nr:UDP-N-acetylmuramate dehydrogenase [Bacteroidales bacterium]